MDFLLLYLAEIIVGKHVDNYVIKQYIDDEGKALQVEINLKDGDNEIEPTTSEALH